ncbi:hypothetical protein HYU22_03030 [Candidatus Woesearchaeota archaeon]|nr:hypothetical protein [Candidatus Woesearchaeota archaeon]
MTNSGLVSDVLQHPLVAPRLDQGIFEGLSGSARLDYVIGVLEEVYAEHPDDALLAEGYQKVRHEFPLYFRTSPPPGQRTVIPIYD